jgi:excisionase family DNA binding protein
MDTNILEKLERIEKLLETQQAMQKQVLNLNDACIYLELSQSHLYKLTSNGSIPHYKPNGKKLYFKREELDAVESLKSELEDTLKKPSQRLRNVLFRLFEQDNDGFKTFSKYYDSRMEQLINHYKGKLG